MDTGVALAEQSAPDLVSWLHELLNYEGGRTRVAGMPGRRWGSGPARGDGDEEDVGLLCEVVLVGVADGLGAVAGAGFVEDPVDVGLDGGVAEDQLVCDLGV
jgi:hypothetical protein